MHDPEDRRLCDALAASPRGLIVVRSADQMGRMVAMIGSLFPRAHMLVVAATWKQVKSLTQRIERFSDRAVTLDLQQLWSMPLRTFVCTMATFAECVSHDWDILIFADVESVIGKRSLESVAQMPGLMRYGFVPADQVMGPATRLRLEQVCGAEIYREPGPEAHRAEVTVVLAGVPGPASLGRHCDLHRKRTLWHHAARNTAITRLAIALAAGERKTVKRLGLPTVDSPAVSLLVESTEHGKELLKGLPGWRLKHNTPNNKGAQRLRTAAVNRAIVTGPDPKSFHAAATVGCLP